MLARCTAVFLLLLTTGAAAQDFKAPRISYLPVDWNAALADVNRNEALRQLAPAPAQSAAPAKADVDLLTRLNTATGKVVPGIAASPVPVLLPLRIDAGAADKAAAAPAAPDGASVTFSADFGKPAMFIAGAAGYDAAFNVALPAPTHATARPARNVEILISGFALLYDVGPRVGGEEKPPVGLQADFPDLRRFYFEGQMRYLFSRYGVLYDVAIECFDGRSNSKRLTCQDAHNLAVPFLKALTIAGGSPRPAPQPVAASTTNRPETASADFAFYGPGEIIPGSGVRNKVGNSDDTVFAAIRFPLAEAPAQAYSQVFMDAGDCTEAIGDSQRKRRHGAPFRCPLRDSMVAAETPSGGAYDYPWRDNFCEMRSFYVGQCPTGMGHQGEDIAPVDCRLYSRDLSQCERKDHPVVAARDGVVLRAAGQETLTLISNSAGEHLLFRYLHMNPKLIDADGFFSGRAVREGEIVGKVGNYAGHDAGTSYHLHFDMQVPTRDGWAFVNPYMTLVLAYERLIGGHGKPIPEATHADAKPDKSASLSAEKSAPAPAKQKVRPRHR